MRILVDKKHLIKENNICLPIDEFKNFENNLKIIVIVIIGIILLFCIGIFLKFILLINKKRIIYTEDNYKTFVTIDHSV
jgi:hypothetical protein